ncbi:MAG: hypothetical protein HYV09_14445 [Deltaproteobacteria bacterium]|nr:hypothetical protein [Deltaproteobacteria bacterium]
MPAPLPPATAYTYAVELGLVGHEGAHVTFDQDVPFYVDNFMGFPTSTKSSPDATDTEIPVGWWREESGAWVPEPNGKVIEITGYDGSTPARASVAPTGLVTNDAERIALATFPVGKKLWRATTRHFSTVDLNMGYGISSTAKRPDKPNASEESIDDPNCASGSVIECENRTLGEHIAVPGTGLTLTYNSARHPGHSKIIRVPVTEPEHADFRGHEVRVVAGGKLLKSILSLKDPTNPKRTIHRFVWDGRDYLGRSVLGDADAQVWIGFSYRVERLTSPGGFGGSCGGVCTGLACTLCGLDSERMTVKLWSEQTLRVTSWDDQASGLGGWTLDAHHWLDPLSRTIFRGDGGTQRGALLEPILESLSLDTGGAMAFDIAPDGTIYTSGIFGALRKARNGVVETRSTSGLLVRLAPDGTLYNAESGGTYQNRLYRFPRASDGTVDIFATPELVAGSGLCSSPILDGMPATAADLCNIWDLAVGQDGTVFLAGSYGVLRIEPPGAAVRRIYRVGSRGTASRAIAVGPDGSVYARFEREVYRIDPSGAETLILRGKSGWMASLVEGVDALLAGGVDGVDPGYLGVATDGTVFVSVTASAGHRIVRVSEGRVFSVAGRDGIEASDCAGTEYGGPASDARLKGPGRIVPRPDGTLYFVDWCYRIRRIRSTFGSLSQYAVPSTDGSQIFTFDAKGRHLRTTNALTNVVETSFEYSDDGRYPTAVIDAYGNRTTIERPTSTDRSRPTKITGPFSQETLLETQPNASGTRWLLWRVTAPNGDRIALQYDSSGELLTGMWTPTANLPSWEQPGLEHAYTYDSLGRLWEDRNPIGGFKQLTESGDHDTWRVTVETALGRKAVHSVRPLNDGLGSTIRESWGPSGSKSKTVKTKTPWTGGSTTQSYAPDGSSSKVVEVGDKRLPGSRWVQSAEAHVPFDTSACDSSGTCPAGLVCEGRIVDGTTVIAPGTCVRSYTTNYGHVVTTDPPNSPDPAHVKTVADEATFNSSKWKVTFDRDAKTSTVQSPLGRKTIVRYAQTTAPGPFLGAAPWQVESVETAPVAKVSYGYDALGRITSAKQCADPAIPSTCREVKYGYKTSGVAKGSLDWVDDPLGKRTSFVRDAAFRATETTLPGARTIGMRFDTAANQVALKAPRHAGTTKEHLFLYDLAGRPVEYRPPTVSGAPNTVFGFNLDDQPTNVFDGLETTFSYDYPSGYPSGQLHAMSHPGGTAVATWRADDRLERLTSVLGDTIEPMYDGALTIGSTATWRVPGTGGALTARTSVQVDPAWLRPSHLLLNDSSPLALAYDGDGLVTGVGALTITRPTSRHDGRMTATTIGSLQTQYHYDAFGELKGEFNADGGPTDTGWGVVTQWAGSADRLKYAYERDGAGRIKAIVEKVGTASHRRLEYQYDDAGRLWKVSEKIGTAPPTLLVEYEYDANGNRTKLTRGGTALTGYAYDDQDRQTSFPVAGGACTQEFTAGRVTRRICPGENTTYAYDATGNLLKVSRAGGPTVEYLVDALGRRIGRREGTGNWTFWVYAGDLAPVAELDHTGAVVSRFVYATRVNVPDYVIQGAKTYRVLTDHLGSVRLVVDTSNGAVAHTVTYDDGAFGALTSETTDAAYVGIYRPMPFGFAGGLHDRTTKLVRFGARDYDPVTGRWLAKDPIGFLGGDPNLYNYVSADPVDLVDPVGTDSDSVQEVMDSARFDGLSLVKGFRTFAWGVKDRADGQLMLGRDETSEQAFDKIRKGNCGIAKGAIQAAEFGGDVVQVASMLPGVVSLRALLRAARLPGGRAGTGPFRFRPDSGHSPSEPLRRGPHGGYMDRFNNEWVRGPYHGDPKMPALRRFSGWRGMTLTPPDRAA